MRLYLTLLHSTVVFAALSSGFANGAVALDRTRIIFNETDKSVSLNISNQSDKSPYLAQGWLENAEGEKITSPLVVLPPIQRLEPGTKSQVRIQGLPSLASLPKDRESIYYFNLREIPPKSEKANTLQFALQTRIKLFYRPAAIMPTRLEMDNPWQEQLTLTRDGEVYQVNNPTPYYITLVFAGSQPGGEVAKGFSPVMLAPKSHARLGVKIADLGLKPVVTYVNDYGGNPQLEFSCSEVSCKASAINPKR